MAKYIATWLSSVKTLFSFWRYILDYLLLFFFLYFWLLPLLSSTEIITLRFENIISQLLYSMRHQYKNKYQGFFSFFTARNMVFTVSHTWTCRFEPEFESNMWREMIFQCLGLTAWCSHIGRTILFFFLLTTLYDWNFEVVNLPHEKREVHHCMA